VGEAGAIPIRITDTLYRIGQEAIANAVRHARPSEISISLEYSTAEVHLSVADDGIGFTPSPISSGFGLRGMRKRAASISAGFKLVTAQGQGTVIHVISPLPPKIHPTAWPKFAWRHLRKREPYVRNNQNSYR
jgi:signal transduction histidine kinase